MKRKNLISSHKSLDRPFKGDLVLEADDLAWLELELDVILLMHHYLLQVDHGLVHSIQLLKGLHHEMNIFYEDLQN